MFLLLLFVDVFLGIVFCLLVCLLCVVCVCLLLLFDVGVVACVFGS